MTKKHNQTPTLSHRPRPSRNERVLRERILKFTYQERFAADLDRAMHDYFGPGALRPGGTLTFDKGEIPAFQEWYIHDDVTAEGERIIDLFAGEVGPRLPAAQQEMLGDWRKPTGCGCSKPRPSNPALASPCKTCSAAKSWRSTTSLPPTPCANGRSCSPGPCAPRDGST